MKTYITSCENDSVAVSTMVGTRKKNPLIWHFVLFRSPWNKFPRHFDKIWWIYFLCLHVRQKALLLLFFFSLFASSRRFWTDLQKFSCVYFVICYAGRCDQDQAAVTGHTGKCFRQGYFNCEIPHVRIWHTMCFRENSNGGFKRFDHVVF